MMTKEQGGGDSRMTPPDRTTDIQFGGPATYRIVVQGALDESWSDRIAGLRITSANREGAAPHTTLVGPIRDQAELSGVLDLLYGLHLPILRVEKLDDES